MIKSKVPERYLGELGGPVAEGHLFEEGDLIAFMGDAGKVVEGEVVAVPHDGGPNLILYRSFDRSSVGTLSLDRKTVHKIINRRPGPRKGAKNLR